MNRNLYLPLLMAVVLAFTSCSKKMGELSSNYFKVTPQPLEVVAGQVPATINGTFPEKYFEKKSVITVTPVLVYPGGESAGTPYTYQGEKVEGNNQSISYKMGGNFTMKTSFAYIPAMSKSELFLQFNVVRGNKSYVLPRVKVADGVIATSELVNANDVPGAIAPDKFQRIITDNYVAKILFLIQQANLRNDQLKSNDMANVKEKLLAASKAENQKITGIDIASAASPDGPAKLNTALAENREKNTVKYMENQMKKDKVVSAIDAKFIAEDWDGFKELVEKSDIQDKEMILRVLSMYNDPEQREKEMRNIAAAFTTVADQILPQLRYSKVTAAIETIGKSDEEISKLAANDAKALSVEELLYAATLVKSNDEKVAIYNKVTDIYPNDFRAYNNIGVINFQEGKVAEASNMFNKAAKINSTAAEVQMNIGLVDLAKRQLAAAETSFGKSAGVNELPQALGTLYIEKGEYQKAVMAFGQTKSNNAALAQLLAGDFNSAKNTLSAVSNKNATTYYLMAIVGARTNNEQMVVNNLKDAVKLDPAMATKAANDIEFSKFNISSIK